MEKVFRAIKRIDEKDNESIAIRKQLDEIWAKIEKKVKDAESTMIAKDYFAYKEKLGREYGEKRKDLLKDYSLSKFNDEYYKIKNYAEENLLVNSDKLFWQVAEFLTLQTGKYFTVKEKTESVEYACKHGHGDYCDNKILKLMYKDKEIFRSRYFSENDKERLQEIIVYPSDYSNRDRFGTLHLILPPDKTVEVFNYLLKYSGKGFGEDYKSNVASVKYDIKNIYAPLLSVAPDFDTNKLSRFIMDFANTHCKVKANKLSELENI